MKIVINGRFLAQKTTGAQRVAIEMTKKLDYLVEPGMIVLAAPIDSNIELELCNIEVRKIGGKSSQKWVQWDLFRFAKQNKAEILTYSGLGSFIAPGFYFAHDVTFRRYPESFSWKFRCVYGFFYRFCLKRCKRIFTISEFSKKELMELYDLDRENIEVIYLSYGTFCEENEQGSEILEKLNLKNTSYILTVGNLNIHKNQRYVEELASMHREYLFVIVGESNAKSFNKINVEKTSSNVVYTGYINDVALSLLYRNAEAFIFPSFYEGFGIPPLEAIKQGCRRIALSDIPVFHEIYGESVYYFNPYEAETFDFDKFFHSSMLEEDANELCEKYTWEMVADDLMISLKNFI